MAMFVHLTSEAAVARTRRAGINCSRYKRPDAIRGVFAVPVTRNFFVSHQWLRELKRCGGGMVAGIYFRVPDEEVVWVGHYNQAHRSMSAAEAIAEFMGAENREGWEVIIPRRISAKEIHRVKLLPQTVGWKYFPEAKGKPPFCLCEYCTRGTYGARKLRMRSPRQG
jgi:hypothetical protein